MTNRSIQDMRVRPNPITAAVCATVAAVYAALVFIHPTSFEQVVADPDQWLLVHMGQLLFVPVLAVGVLHLLRCCHGAPAMIARIAVVFWAAWFCAFDAIAGIAFGILVDGGANDAGKYLFDHGLVGGTSVLGAMGQGTWLVVAIAAGIALRASDAARMTYVATFVSALIAVHGGPIATIGFLALTVALWTGLRDATLASPAAMRLS